jgi:hypothetical protein
MYEDLSTDLLIAAASVFAFGALVASRCISNIAAVILAGVRVLLPLVYFGAFYNETWTFLDDLWYTRQAAEFLHRGYTPLSILVSPNGPGAMAAVSSGWHVAYLWWNILAQYLFGEHYYSAVFLNIALSFVAGWMLFRICCMGGFSLVYRRAFFGFFLLQPELVVWSSFINVKDIAVMTLTIALCYLLLALSHKPTLRHVALLLACMICLRFLRFYVSAVFLVAALTWYAAIHYKAATAHSHLSRAALALVAGLVVSLSVPQVRDYGMQLLNGIGLNDVAYYREQYLSISPAGSLRWLLTPRPWGVGSESSFLVLPALLHWALVIPAVGASVHLWRTCEHTKLCLIYFAIAVLLYGAFELEQSPRHRIQVTFVIAWLQFHALWLLSARRSSVAAVRCTEMARA